jgi:hypothetical protein
MGPGTILKEEIAVSYRGGVGDRLQTYSTGRMETRTILGYTFGASALFFHESAKLILSSRRILHTVYLSPWRRNSLLPTLTIVKNTYLPLSLKS